MNGWEIRQHTPALSQTVGKQSGSGRRERAKKEIQQRQDSHRSPAIKNALARTNIGMSCDRTSLM